MVSRVFNGVIEVRVKVSSAAVNQQDRPVEVNEGIFAFLVCRKSGEQITTIPDITPQTAEQWEEYQRAMARQVLRGHRQEAAPKPRTSISTAAQDDFSVMITANSIYAEQLALNCISIILRLKESSEFHWEAMPVVDWTGVNLSIDLGRKELGIPTRLKVWGSVKSSPRKCFEILRDWKRRAEWDISFHSYSDQKAIGESAELVQIILVGGGTRSEVKLLRGWCEHGDTGTFVIASRSVRFETHQGNVREGGGILPTGYVVSEVVGSQGSEADITFVGQFGSDTLEIAKATVLASFDKFRNLVEQDQGGLNVK